MAFGKVLGIEAFVLPVKGLTRGQDEQLTLDSSAYRLDTEMLASVEHRASEKVGKKRRAPPELCDSDSELAVVSVDSFPAPTLIARADPSTRKKFFEFFTVPIRNANTRAAYYRAIQQFLAWCERAGYQDLEDIEPITAAAYIETLQRQAAPPTVKQHMAAIRMLFSWLTEKGVLAMNPAREVKTERFSRTEGKTPAFVEGEVQKLLAQSRHPRTPASAIALCSALLPTLSPGSAPS